MWFWGWSHSPKDPKTKAPRQRATIGSNIRENAIQTYSLHLGLEGFIYFTAMDENTTFHQTRIP